MPDERVAVLHHVSIEDLGPTDSCPLSENVLGVLVLGSFSERRPQQFKNTWWFDRRRNLDALGRCLRCGRQGTEIEFNL
jgi:hypothetical protein